MSDRDNQKTKKSLLLLGFGIVVIIVAGFGAGFYVGQMRQMRKDSAGNLFISLHYLTLLETNNLEKLKRDLRFFIYAQVDTQYRLDGAAITNGMSSDQLARWTIASSIHSEMTTQVVTFTPQQMMDTLNSQSATNAH